MNHQIEPENNLSIDISAINYVKTLANRMPGGFFIYRADGNQEIIYANKSMLRIFNCSSMEEFQELTGNSFRGIVHPDDLAAVERSINEQISRSEDDLDYVEYRIIQKGGKIRWLEDYGHFTQSDKEGNIFYVFVVDATERKLRLMEEKEEQLQEQLRRLDMIEGLSIDFESIFYADLDLDRIQAYRVSRRFGDKFSNNRSVTQFTGFDSDYIKKWVCPEDRHRVAQATDPEYIRNRLSKSKLFHINYRVMQNGKTKYLQLRIVNVNTGSSHVSQIVMGYRSVDDEIIYEMEQKKILEETLEQAKSSNIAKNTFLSNMSHDIRTPMNAIVGFAALAKKHLDDKKKVHNYLDMIETSSDHLLRLMNDVLEISSIESGKIHIEENECSLLDIAQEVQSTILPRAAAKDISLSLNIAGLKHYTVYSDQQKLTQIILRLARNAVKYTEPGGKITITVQELEQTGQHHATYRFIIEDNGIGISEAFLEHIFEPFERQKNTTLSGVYGTGLGLTITKNIIDMMNGTIKVNSSTGKGSTFTVMLNLRIQDRQFKPLMQKISPAIHLPERKRILLVEDNEINLEIEVKLLQDVGFFVDTATDGSIAVEKIRNSKPGDYALVLMDIQMPVMDGYQAAKEIRKLENEIHSGIPIIALSANVFPEDYQKSQDAGMNAHVAKPVNIEQLDNVIRELLAE